MDCGGPRPVLLVNDDPAQLTLLSGLLKRDGCEVTTCESAELAVNLLAGLTNEHLVITDLNMPGLSGVELLGAVRQFGLSCPLIIISASEVADQLVAEVESKQAVLLAPYKVTRVRKVARSILAGEPLESHFHHPEYTAPEEAQPQVLVDREALEKLVQVGGSALLTRVVGMFLEKTPNNIGLLSGYVTEIDHYNIERTAHTVKGSAGMLGARRIQEAAKKLEHAASDQLEHSYVELLQGLKDEYESAKTFFEAVVSGDEKF